MTENIAVAENIAVGLILLVVKIRQLRTSYSSSQYMYIYIYLAISDFLVEFHPF